MQHINITINGRVQGVGFRNFAKNQARYLGIKGYVKNQFDGSVFIEAEGDNAALAQFVQWCRKGPSFSEVDEVVVNESDIQHFVSFDVRY